MKEEDIRPQRIFDEYLRLAELDTHTYFKNSPRSNGACPACRNIGTFAFSKHDFVYEKCDQCDTLYVNPRPGADSFSDYYTNAPSVEYWATTFYKETANSRREKLWRPKAEKIWDIMTSLGEESSAVVDIGGGFGLFGQEFRSLTGVPPTIIEPGPNLASVCRESALPVVQKFLEEVSREDLPFGHKTFVSFELFEHLHSPEDFLSHLWDLMDVGDLFIFTTLSGTGVDILALWEDSKSVMPPHHLNFFNPSSVKIILSRLKFEVIEVSTPGKLDIDILCNNKSLIKDRFLKQFVSDASDIEKEMWQKLISESGRSSHMMVTCRKM